MDMGRGRTRWKNRYRIYFREKWQIKDTADTKSLLKSLAVVWRPSFILSDEEGSLMWKINNLTVQLASPAERFTSFTYNDSEGSSDTKKKSLKMGFLMDTIATAPHEEHSEKRKNAKWNVSQAWIFRRTDVGEKSDERGEEIFTQQTGRESLQLKFLGRFRPSFALRLITFDWRWAPLKEKLELLSKTHVNGFLNGGPIGGWFIDGSDLIYGSKYLLNLFSFLTFISQTLLGVNKKECRNGRNANEGNKGAPYEGNFAFSTINKTHHMQLFLRKLFSDLCRWWNWFSSRTWVNIYPAIVNCLLSLPRGTKRFSRNEIAKK